MLEGSREQRLRGVLLKAKERGSSICLLHQSPSRLQARPSSLQQNLHQGLQLVFHVSVYWRQVLGLHDDLVGLLEEVLPHRCLHALAPGSQLGAGFEDVAAGADRLWGEGAIRQVDLAPLPHV